MTDKDKPESIQPELAKPAGNVIGALKPKLTGKQIIKEAAKYVNEHISRQPPVQRFFSFMPTMLTRVSPFHFKGRHKSNEWPLVRLDSGDNNSWGSMQVVGELLIIFDETTLFCLLALMTKYERDAFETSHTELARMAGIESTPKNSFEICKTIPRMAGTRIDLSPSRGKGKKRKTSTELN